MKISTREIIEKNKEENIGDQAEPSIVSDTKGKFGFFKFVIVIIVCIGIAFGVYYYFFAPTKEEIVNKRNQILIEKIGRLMVLPQDEAPAIYSIDNPDILKKEQAFFTNVEKGDKLLIYPKNARAVIYSEIKNIIVNVGPITINQEEKSSEQISVED